MLFSSSAPLQPHLNTKLYESCASAIWREFETKQPQNRDELMTMNIKDDMCDVCAIYIRRSQWVNTETDSFTVTWLNINRAGVCVRAVVTITSDRTETKWIAVLFGKSSTIAGFIVYLIALYLPQTCPNYWFFFGFDVTFRCHNRTATYLTTKKNWMNLSVYSTKFARFRWQFHRHLS